MNYKDKLKDPRWQKKRLYILNRDDWKCQICFNAVKPLVVHHKQYLPGNKPWEYDNNWLITLCETCHEKIHAVNPIKVNVQQIRKFEAALERIKYTSEVATLWNEIEKELTS